VGDITFLKEQAWKIEFANEEVQPQPFHEVIRVSGQLNARPSDEQVVTAKSNGVVRWNDVVVPGASVKKGQRLFILASGNVAQGNIESQHREAKVNFEKAEADYNRVQPLLADKIVSQKDYLEIKNRYDQARIQFETLNRNYTEGGQAVQSPITGFVKQISVRSGEYVEAGQALAVITKDLSLQLQADVPVRYATQLPLISEANFRTLHDNTLYNTKELNGEMLSYGKALGENASLLPVYFSLTNNGSLIPGQAVEVYLKSKPIENAFVLPISALIEEQGNFFVYVQVAGESFNKHEVKLGAQDGTSVQIISGLNAGERVVTKGAYLVKLATQSGSVPAHGHEH
jgi:RND family efflux transporter MFP subunit